MKASPRALLALGGVYALAAMAARPWMERWGSTQRSASVRRAVAGWVWFALMIGGWSAFFGLLLFSESTLDELWQSLRDLPLVIEGLELESK